LVSYFKAHELWKLSVRHTACFVFLHLEFPGPINIQVLSEKCAETRAGLHIKQVFLATFYQGSLWKSGENYGPLLRKKVFKYIKFRPGDILKLRNIFGVQRP